ncbi:unnamed protein product [Symbiodinium sp. CCMP2456]|nr:unnamed protein product [Symbiodinium sp. CCMP2456]
MDVEFSLAQQLVSGAKDSQAQLQRHFKLGKVFIWRRPADCSRFEFAGPQDVRTSVNRENACTGSGIWDLRWLTTCCSLERDSCSNFSLQTSVTSWTSSSRFLPSDPICHFRKDYL